MQTPPLPQPPDHAVPNPQGISTSRAACAGIEMLLPPSEANRSLFAFAAYNSGPGRIASMRKEAVKRGLDPDKWFNNVELVTAEKVGIETTTYVRNIFKYYTTYKLILDHEETHKRAREAVKRAS